MNGAYQAIGKLVGLAARASQALGARNFACDNGAAVVLYGLAGESNSTLHFFLARCCLGQVPGGAPFSQRSEQATACTNRMQIRN